MKRFEEFQSHIVLIQTFDLPMKILVKQKRNYAMILDAKQPKVKRDEMEFSIPNNLKIKYREVVTFYETTRDYDKSLKTTIAGVPHEFAWGGLHGARKITFAKGYF